MGQYDETALAALATIRDKGAAAVISRTTYMGYDPASGGPIAFTTAYPVFTVLTSIDDSLVNGSSILATDESALVPASGLTITPDPTTDALVITATGTTYRIISTKTLDPGGTAILYTLVIRGTASAPAGTDLPGDGGVGLDGATYPLVNVTNGALTEVTLGAGFILDGSNALQIDPAVIVTPAGLVAAHYATDADVAAQIVAGIRTIVFTQNTPLTLWTINHGLNRYPAVAVTDSSGRLVEGDVTFLSANSLTLSFAAGFAGSAYLN